MSWTGWRSSETLIWLYAKHPLLNGARAIDLIYTGDADPVVGVIESLSDGTYTSVRRHDRSILDAMDAMEPESFSADVWRVTSRGRDPLRGSAAPGRWTPPGAFEVLYTNLERNGALTEIGYRLSFEPALPSRA